MLIERTNGQTAFRPGKALKTPNYFSNTAAWFCPRCGSEGVPERSLIVCTNQKCRTVILTESDH